MPSTVFTYQDAVNAARELLKDSAKRTWPDAEIKDYWIPRVLAQLRFDRPDLFAGNYSFTKEPALADFCAFDDAGYNAFVEALVAAIHGSSSESVDRGQAEFADSRAERARRQ